MSLTEEARLLLSAGRDSGPVEEGELGAAAALDLPPPLIIRGTLQEQPADGGAQSYAGV